MYQSILRYRWMRRTRVFFEARQWKSPGPYFAATSDNPDQILVGE